MDRTFIRKLYGEHQACQTCPAPAEISSFFNDLLGTLFSESTQLAHLTLDEFEQRVENHRIQLDRILQHVPSCERPTSEITSAFFDNIPAIHSRLREDIRAMYEGDPAAKNESEVVRTYPGFYAIAAYRIAHLLHRLGVSDVPRIITEHAHSKTGIDIHPNAKIGHHFCIDHGTGVVIGETSDIGDHVKIYQGVTLGALSVNKEDASKKRHPTIEDYVVIYAGATILGGDTVIGHNTIIGGNVWLTRSVPPNSKVYYQSKMYHVDTEVTDLVVLKTH